MPCLFEKKLSCLIHLWLASIFQAGLYSSPTCIHAIHTGILYTQIVSWEPLKWNSFTAMCVISHCTMLVFLYKCSHLCNEMQIFTVYTTVNYFWIQGPVTRCMSIHSCLYCRFHMDLQKWGQPGLAGLTPVFVHMMRSILHQLTGCVSVQDGIQSLVIMCFSVMALL